MSQIQVNNRPQVQENLDNLQQDNRAPVANNVQPQVQQPLEDVNARALSRLSDTDRAAAEVFLKGVTTQEALKHTKWSLATKIISGLFTFGIAPAIMCHVESKKERQLAQDVVGLKNTLHLLDKNVALKGTSVLMDGKPMTIHRDANGELTATIGGERIVSNYNAKTLAEKIEDDVVTNTDLYGTRAALDILEGPKKSNVGKVAQKGHAGQSLVEQYNAAMKACDRRIAKAEAAIKDNPEALKLRQELADTQSALDKLQAEFDKTEMACNQTIRQCDEQLKAAEKAQSVLEADLSHGAVDAYESRQAAITSLREQARQAKNAALNQLRDLEKRKPELYQAMARRDTLLSNPMLLNDPMLIELNKAEKEKANLTTEFEKTRQELTAKLNELKSSPDRNTQDVQNKIQALTLVLAEPQNQDGQQEDPFSLNSSDPKDALDSKGLNDARLRELCLKSIKANLGIDGGELHSCPTRYLSRIAQYAVEGYYGSATNLIDHVLKISSTSRIVSTDVMELMSVREKDFATGQKVNVAILRPLNNPLALSTQKQVANFAADIIYSGNIVDEDKLSPEIRLRKVLTTNAGVIGDIIKVEAGLNAVNLETKARDAEAKAAKPDATLADKLEAQAARAEANAAQFTAKTLRGSVAGKGLNVLGNFFGGFFGAKKVDESKFTSLESLAYAAEAKMLNDNDRKPLVLRLATAQAEVDEYGDDPARLSELVDARKALEEYDRTSPISREATEARLAVRLARAEAQAKLTKSEVDQEKADNLRDAIEAAKPGVPDATLGAEFDVSADNALGNRLVELDDLPEAERTSLLGGLPEEMSEAVKDMMGDMTAALLEKNMPADSVSIALGITQLTSKVLQKIVGQINESVTKAAQTVQDDMTTAILMMDNSLTAPTKAVVREFKAALEAEKLALTQENVDALLARKPGPQAVSTALDKLSAAITGVDDPVQRRRLASKVAVNAFVEYARLADNARQAQEAATQAADAEKNASKREFDIRLQINAAMTKVSNADDAWKAKQTQAAQSQTQAEQAEVVAHNAEVTAQALEEYFASQPENARDALERERVAAEAESHAASLEDVAAKAKDVADEADLMTLVAGAPADAQEKARAARMRADEASAAAQNARNEATSARNVANDAAAALEPQVLAEARTAQESAASARANATQLRQEADTARATANQDQTAVTTAKQAYDEAVGAYTVTVQSQVDAQTAKAQSEAANVKAKAEAEAAKAEADAALGENAPVAEPENAPAAAPANEAEAHSLRLQQLGAANLDSLVAAAGTDFTSDGMGKFIKFVIQDYFQSVPLMDKRAMVSAGLRYAPPNATPMQQLGAMLKGAGPVLQKIFQGLDGPGLPQDLRIACQDMKSRLAPIPPDIVEANLLDMVNSSNGRIRNIEVLSSLGAASIGQAFRCRITDQQGQSRECVVKILRPDAANRVQRERPIFEKAAAKVPGMLGTFQGQMEGIMEELDFGIEAGNAKSGVVYDKPFDGKEKSIQSVKVVEDIPPKSNSMAMELAPGTTIDGFLKDTREEIERMGQNLGRSEEFNAQGQRSRVTYGVPEGRLHEFAPVKARLQELYDEAQARHKQLTALAEVWVTEGIFGEQGFFHGDLHTGNIMSDGKNLTVIDFGNATKLTQEQQSSVMTMIVATTTRQSSKFLDAFRAMLPTQSQANFDAKRQQILESVRVIMQKGTLSDTGGRIAAILGEIQRNGVEIPHAIYNFSNSQIRLQNSINEMITLMNHIQEEMRAIDTLRSQISPSILPYDRSIADTVLAAMADDEQSHESVMSYIAQYEAQIGDSKSTLSLEQEHDVRESLSFPTFLAEFKAKTVDKDPVLLDLWNQHKDAFENTTHPGHEEVVTLMIGALKDKALRTLSDLKAEEQKDHSRRASPNTFLDVMSDVVDTNKSGAVKKLGFGSSLKYGITNFIHDNITELVQPKI